MNINRFMKIKKIYVILVAFLLFILLSPSMAKKGDTVAVDYWLTADSKQIDTSEGREVFEFNLNEVFVFK